MGCTSSAPNTISANTNTADKNTQIEEESTKEQSRQEVGVADTEDENQTNETEVLPMCDTFEQPVQIVRNNKSTDSLLHETDVPANVVVNENEDLKDEMEKIHEINHVTKMELLMEKVFETNHHLHEKEQKDNGTDSAPVDLQDTVETTDKTAEDKNEEIPLESNDDHPEIEVEDDVEATEEVEEPSPSQSQSSRATRWEALADIAAELPPSMAVDPLTGQIYALTK